VGEAYEIRLDDKYGQLRPFDVAEEAAAVTERWFNQTLTTVNDAVVLMVEPATVVPTGDSGQA
jgi:hypothetical protein